MRLLHNIVILPLVNIYPTREIIAKLIVKTLGLEEKDHLLDTNVTFSDEADFTDDSMRYYAKIAHSFGLFMTGSLAKPQETISRADLSMVIRSIFMIPTATLSLTPATVEYGETLAAGLSNIHAEGIDGVDYTLYNSSGQVQTTYIVNGLPVSNPMDSTSLAYALKTLYAIIDNNGVKNFISTALNITFTDQDGDGFQDTVDRWISDPKYTYDDNNNDIPDILDVIYDLSTYTARSIININGQVVAVADMIRDAGFVPDLDGDGVSDYLDPDIDGDGTVNLQDAFPRDSSEWQDSDGDGIGDNSDDDIDGDGILNAQDAFPRNASEWLDTDNDGTGNNADTDDDGDGVLDNNDELPLNPNESVDTDNDGIGNNADKDDDNDGISDTDEIKWGFDPLDASDGGDADSDGDGVTNADEIEAGSDPLDPDDIKKPKKFVPIMMDDMVIMVPLVD